ncbi:MAG: STAS domain-containing protein [Planctomycetes bacterium]|nr:STAS domain-containing protein [Planctomycetota bacterium]
MLDFEYERAGQNNDILVVVLSGTLDEQTCGYLMECVKEDVLEGSTKMILDCERLDFISSMGLAMLVRVSSRMKKLNGDVKLAAVQGLVAQAIHAVRLNLLFQIYPTVDDAIAAHGG